MKKKYPFLILLIFLILGIGIFTGIHFSQSIKKQNDTNNRLMENIKNTNQDITNEIQLYNENKKKIATYLSSYYAEQFQTDYETIYKLYQQEDQIMKKIEQKRTFLKKKCGQSLYPDQEVNSICNKYEKTYQKLLEVYQNDISAFNDTISLYNEDATQKLEYFQANDRKSEE